LFQFHVVCVELVGVVDDIGCCTLLCAFFTNNQHISSVMSLSVISVKVSPSFMFIEKLSSFFSMYPHGNLTRVHLEFSLIKAFNVSELSSSNAGKRNSHSNPANIVATSGDIFLSFSN
jgi:hypothetical protein